MRQTEKKIKLRRILGALFVSIMLGAGSACAEEFQCEVLSVEGKATVVKADGSSAQLKEGDLVSKGSKIETTDFSSLNLSFDKEWQNILSLEMQTAVALDSVAPAQVSLEKGSVYAKLKKLPKKSTFKVSTPTAVAAVRGTEFLTAFKAGETQIYNPSSSEVSVYGVDASGAASGEPVVLSQSKKTSVAKAGEAPSPVTLMTSEEVQKTEKIATKVTKQVEVAEESGRVGKIQDIGTIEAVLEAKKAYEEVESRVVDTRRRSFKKT